MKLFIEVSPDPFPEKRISQVELEKFRKKHHLEGSWVRWETLFKLIQTGEKE